MSDDWKERFNKFIKEAAEDGGDEKFITPGYWFNEAMFEFIQSEIRKAKEEERERIIAILDKQYCQCEDHKRIRQSQYMEMGYRSTHCSEPKYRSEQQQVEVEMLMEDIKDSLK